MKPPAQDDPRFPRRGARGLRPHPDRQRAGAIGADRVLAARSRFLPVACQARLSLDPRAAISPAIRAARHPDGVSENLGVVISMKDAHAPEDEQVRPLAASQHQGPLLQAGHSAHDRAADRGLFLRAAAVVWREVSGQDRPRAAGPCQRAARPPRGRQTRPVKTGEDPAGPRRGKRWVSRSTVRRIATMPRAVRADTLRSLRSCPPTGD